MPRRHPHQQQSGGGAKCINMILFVFTVMFMIDRSIQIRDRKIFADNMSSKTPEIQEWFDFEIDCKEKVLTWITVAFFQYYGFMILTLVIVALNSAS